MRCLRCAKTARGRGLCKAHYARAVKLVELSPMTWEQLEREGRARPPLWRHGGVKTRARDGPEQETANEWRMKRD